MLKDVFGVSGNSNDPGGIIRTQIFENPAFGGGCDRYSGKIINNTLEHPRLRCFGGIGVSDIVTFNPMRAAAVSKACDTLVKNPNTFSHAMSKINNTIIPIITYPGALEKAYQLFYPEQPLSSDMENALIAIGTHENNSSEKWQNVILRICVTPEWQTLY